MNTATTTLTLHEGYFARRNWFDWLFAALAVVGGLYALQRYGAYMDGYEKGILLGAMFVAEPMVGVVSTSLWIGIFALAYGLFQIFASFRIKKLAKP